MSDDQKSVTRQIEHATDYAKQKGWRVAEEHIYSDDGISGAEVVNHPGFIWLMNALIPKPPFQVLIMSEESRLGREQINTAYALQRLTEAGMQVWFYLNDQERKLDTAMDKLMGSIIGFALEEEREKAQVRTYDAMKRKAGHVTGGEVFGYDNCDIAGTMRDAQGCPKRSHVELRTNEPEAEVVRKTFRLYAEGHGFTSIAKMLDAAGAICLRPRPSFSLAEGLGPRRSRTGPTGPRSRNDTRHRRGNPFGSPPQRIRVWCEVRGDETRYHFQEETGVGRFFSGLVGVKRFGVPNGI